MHKSASNVFFAGLLTLAACGSQATTAKPPAADSNTPTTVPSGDDAAPAGKGVGSVEGHALTPQSAVSASISVDSDATASSNAEALVLFISSQANYCANLAARTTEPNHVGLVAQVLTLDANSNTLAIQAGTYAIVDQFPDGGGNFGLAAFRASGSNCESLLDDDQGTATSGSIVLTNVTDTQVTGTYAVTFPGGTLKGGFTAPNCQALAEQATSGGDLSCSP